MLKKILLGFLFMPLTPMAIVDILFLNNALNLFKIYDQVSAKVVDIGANEVSVRMTSNSANGAIYTNYRTPYISFSYQIQGKTYLSNNVSIVGRAEGLTMKEVERLSSAGQPTFKGLGIGSDILVYTSKSNPSLAYLYLGYALLTSLVFQWVKVYLIFASFFSLSFLLIYVVKRK